MKKQRNSNIELLRIVSMFMIILSHYVYYALMHNNQENVCETWEKGTTLLKYLTSGCILGQIGVGLFFSITGYFTINRKDTPSLKKLFSEVLFYAPLSIIIMIFGMKICGYAYDSKSNLISLVLQTVCVPLTGSPWWFVTAYVVLILFSKSVNSFMSLLNKNGYIAIIVIIGIFGLIFGKFGSNFYDLERAVFYYLLGGYFKLYNKAPKKSKILLYSIVLFTLLLINSVLQFNIYSNLNNIILGKFFSMLGLTIEPFLVSVIFYIFSNLKIEANIVVNKIASYTFGIYLLHEAPYTRELLWNKLVNADHYYLAGSTFWVYSIIVIIMVFFIGSMIDILRQKIFDKIILFVINNIIDKFKKSFLTLE